MFKNYTLQLFLLICIIGISHSIEARTEQRVETVRTATVNNFCLKEDVTLKSKKKVKKRWKFKLFKKFKEVKKESNEEWLINRALIFGTISWVLFFGGLLAGSIVIALGAVLGVFALAYGIAGRKRGVRHWKNNLGLIMGAIVCGIMAVYVTIAAIFIIQLIAES